MKVRSRIISVVLTVSVLAIAGVSYYFYLMNREQLYDPNFDTSVAEPAYRENGPRVLFDEAHHNRHTTTTAYKPFADLIRNDGYEVQTLKQLITAERLSGFSVLVIALPQGSNETNDSAAFTEAETAAVEQWVRAGGSLLLITDHWPFGAAAEGLGRRFGIDMSKGLVQDPKHFEPSMGDTHLVFSRENGLLADNPITNGRNPAERVQKVLTFTGQSLRGPSNSMSFLNLGESAVDRPPSTPRVTKDGSDVRVNMDYGDPVPATGRSQGLALEVGKGRVVVLGEAAMLSAQISRGVRSGMNFPGYDDRQLALNIMHWLSRAL